MLHALATPFASLLSFYYSLIPSFGVAITLLTVTVMILLSPLTIKAVRSQLVMQRIAPDMKRLQDKHKNDRVKLQAEVQQLWKDNGASPVSGCIPMLLQIPVFFIMYSTISGLTHKTNGHIDPKYLDHSSEMYRKLIETGGQMKSFGIDLASSATGPHANFLHALPYYALVVLMVALQYVQQWQISSRMSPEFDTPQAQQMRMIQKFFPPFFGLISLGFPAGMVLYWSVQNLFRVFQQWAIYRFDPVLKANVESAHKEAVKFLEEDDGKPGRATSGNSTRLSKSSDRSAAAKNKSKKRKGRK